MSQREPTDRLSAVLRELERRAASDGFTDRVLGRIDARAARRRRAARLALAAGAALVALGIGALAVLRPASAPFRSDPAATRTAEIRRQRQLLEEELERLKRASDRSRPVLYIGSGEAYDLVLDLGPLLEQELDAPVVPALQDLRVRPLEARDASRREP